VIARDWRTYLDRKVLHFALLYLLWVTIQFGFKAPSFAAETSWAHAGFLYLEAFIEPFARCGVIYLLPVFFVRRQGNAANAAAGDLERGRVAGDDAYRNRLDRDR